MFHIADRRTASGQTSRVENSATVGGASLPSLPFPSRFLLAARASRLFPWPSANGTIWRRFVGSNIPRTITTGRRSPRTVQLTVYRMDGASERTAAAAETLKP